MTIEEELSQNKVYTLNKKRSIPESNLFASYILKPQSNYLNIALSSPHWQLKDLLISSSNSSLFDDYSNDNNLDSKFYFPYKDRVFSFNFSNFLSDHNNSNLHLHTKKINYSSIKFQSNPRCLKELDGIVVTGGINSSSNNDLNSIGLKKGSFSIYNSHSSITENIQVGEFITNSVSINKLKTSGLNHYCCYICNNDKNLYKFDITPSKIIQSSNPIYLKVALNHSILSNDNSTLITVGDSSKIFISHPQENNLSISNFDIIQTNGDCGFSTSFLPNGYQFITCFQDGLSLIYDLRNLSNPIHSINSTRPKTQPGAFRVVKTSKNNDDIICISEHQGRVHLIDSRNFNNHSVIMLPKYLYNVPPTMSVSSNSDNNADNMDDNDNDNNDDDDNSNNTDDHDMDDRNNSSNLFGCYPISISTDRESDLSKQWYNQPIVKDIDDFKDLDYFGGDLNLGYLESYRYMDSRYNNYGTSYRNNESNPYRIALQGSFDREDILKKKSLMNFNPKFSNLLSYDKFGSNPIQMRYNENISKKINEQEENFNYEICKNTEIRSVGEDCWWDDKVNQVTDFTEMWPWGKKTKEFDDDFQGEKKGIMEIPQRDPFFYVDSDIEINGLELSNRNGKTTLCIGTKEGIVLWDINDWKRKCFPSFEYF